MKNKFDVIVIGGGPAGMMVAARASARGRSVLLLEKNSILGKKLSITGGGRCNVTNNKPVVRDILSQYKDSGKFLFSTFIQHGVAETVQWFKERGVDFVEEDEGRLFPETLKAETICQVLRQAVDNDLITVKKSVTVLSVSSDRKDKVFSVRTTAGDFQSKSCVVAAGGTSRPETGSTGEGFDWLRSLGHTIVSNSGTLVPLVVKDSWISRLSGVTLPAVKLTVFADGVKQSVHAGKLLFTHVGVSGPTVLNLSKSVGELLEDSAVVIRIDFLPTLDEGELKIKLKKLLDNSANKKVKNIISELVPVAISTVLLEASNLDGDLKGHHFSTVNCIKMIQNLKAFPLTIKGLQGTDKAIVSGGGVKLEEVEFKTMESRVVPGLYLVGDVLNINRPSGGYSLQICWSTGFVAGDNA